jgi:Ankyrin repeats (3 copies)/Ankyrin repeat
VPTLPAHPNLEHLRRQAKELLRAAKAGEPDAVRRVEAVSDRLTLTAAQLAVAREYGFASWPRLKDEVEARTLELAQKVDAFCEASIGGNTRRAARMLAEAPVIASYSFATAVILGDADHVRDELLRDPSLATRPDPRTGWTALHAACASRWHQLDPTRAAGLLAVARLLLDAGADPTGPAPGRPGRGARWRPLRCAIAASNSGPSNRPVVGLLLDRGAVPDDHDLYLAGFAHDRRQLLPLLLAHLPNLGEIAEQALAAAISNDDSESARLLLEAGAEPRRYRDDDGQPTPVVWAAVRAGCDAGFLGLLLSHQADPNAAGPDGRTPYQLATAAGRTEITELLYGHGATDSATSTDRFLSACRRADHVEAQRQLGNDPGLLDRLTGDERAAIIRAAEAGDTAAVALMLGLGFPLETRGDNGATALHTAAYAGSAGTVQLLLDRGADIEARDTTWNSTPLEWAAVGSGERPTTAPDPDWPRTVRILLENGASTNGITLTPDDPKPPSQGVAALLQARLEREPGQ